MLLYASFPLIWYATWLYYEKVKIFCLGPGTPREMGLSHLIKILFDMFHIYHSSACIRKFPQNINNFVIAKIKYLTFDPT